jgi:hypothetical protein
VAALLGEVEATPFNLLLEMCREQDLWEEKENASKVSDNRRIDRITKLENSNRAAKAMLWLLLLLWLLVLLLLLLIASKLIDDLNGKSFHAPPLHFLSNNRAHVKETDVIIEETKKMKCF